jgi:NAD(P)H-hydrate epimerase
MGAALITAESALYSGCGLATALVPAKSFAAFNIRLPELILYPQDTEIHKVQGNFSALLMGPGLSTAKASAHNLKNLIQAAPGPMVLDADAINILSENPTWLRFLPAGTILCPHPGEMKRLLKVKKLEHNYLILVKDFAQKYHLNILLKDAISVLVSKEGNFIYSDFGTPALAKAGSGDCLTGIIGSLLAQAYAPKAAVCLALYLHGTAAKYAAKESSAESVVASDVSLNIGKAFRSLDLL